MFRSLVTPPAVASLALSAWLFTAALPTGHAMAEEQTGDAIQEEGSADGAASPMEAAEKADKGSLTNPYSGDADAAKQGHELYMAAGCNGCHGGTGGGGMGPPLSNPVWIYGDDDDTLFRLIALGSDPLLEHGYTRTGSEKAVGPMPAQGTIVKSTDDMWKIITWIHSINS